MEKKNTSVKHILVSLSFAAAFILLLTSLTYMIRPAGDTKTRFMGFYAEPKDSLDIVMIGSSPTYSSLVTPELYGEYGIKAYPLASNVQRPIAGMYLVREAEKIQSPILYMFEMRMYAGIEIGLASNMAYTREVTDNMKYSFNRVDTINAMVTDHITSEDTEKYTYFFDIFKYHSNWYTLVNPSQWAAFGYTVSDPHKGYKITDKVGPTHTPFASDNAQPAQIDPYQEQALDDLLRYLDSIGAHALFYVAPYSQKENDAAKYAYIRDKVTAAGYDYLDMNLYYKEIGLDFSRDTSDYGIHMNAVGGRKCTQFLADYLTEHYDFPDHRSDEKKDASWDKAYELWQSEYEEAEKRIDERIRTEDYFVYEE